MVQKKTPTELATKALKDTKAGGRPTKDARDHIHYVAKCHFRDPTSALYKDRISIDIAVNIARVFTNTRWKAIEDAPAVAQEAILWVKKYQISHDYWWTFYSLLRKNDPALALLVLLSEAAIVIKNIYDASNTSVTPSQQPSRRSVPLTNTIHGQTSSQLENDASRPGLCLEAVDTQGQSSPLRDFLEISKALVTGATLLPGPQREIPTERCVPDTAPVILCAMKGDVEGLRNLFSRGLASPRDVSCSRRYNLLMVSFTSPFFCYGLPLK